MPCHEIRAGPDRTSVKKGKTKAHLRHEMIEQNTCHTDTGHYNSKN